MMENEKRLINANALMAYIHNHDYELVSRMGCVDKGMFTDGIEHGINIQKTVDAVEVVRCKDCNHFDAGDGFNRPLCTHMYGLKTAHESLYCPFGERKTDG